MVCEKLQFCKECGTRLAFKILKDEKDKELKVMACTKEDCGFYVQAKGGRMEEGGSETSEGQIRVIGKEDEKQRTMPTVTIPCPKCNHKEAVWWLLQTRSGDEPPTQFYRCTQCNHTWRNYA
tara:strand:+ start:6953 stop:7318 length:366 start_codon:yes stop_codon:yes gene_type:complete